MVPSSAKWCQVVNQTLTSKHISCSATKQSYNGVVKIFSVHCSIFWLRFGDDHLFCIHPALPESWVLSWTWNSHVACKVCKMVKSFQDVEKFAKWWKVCKMVKSLENGEKFAKWCMEIDLWKLTTVFSSPSRQQSQVILRNGWLS